MTNPNDLIEYPAQPGEFGRRVLIDALIAAGYPRTNSLSRLADEQQDLYDRWQAGESGYNPADNPRDETQQLAHVRGVSADIDPRPSLIAALEKAGLIRPYSYEPWHWQVAGDVRRFALVRSRPDFHPNPTTTPSEDDDMLMLRIKHGAQAHLCSLAPGVFRHFIASDPHDKIMRVARSADDWQDIDLTELPAFLRTYGCDLNIWDIRNGQFVVLDPLTGTVKPGNMWSATNANRASVRELETANATTIAYLAQLVAGVGATA